MYASLMSLSLHPPHELSNFTSIPAGAPTPTGIPPTKELA